MKYLAYLVIISFSAAGCTATSEYAPYAPASLPQSYSMAHLSDAQLVTTAAEKVKNGSRTASQKTAESLTEKEAKKATEKTTEKVADSVPAASGNTASTVAWAYPTGEFAANSSTDARTSFTANFTVDAELSQSNAAAQAEKKTEKHPLSASISALPSDMPSSASSSVSPASSSFSTDSPSSALPSALASASPPASSVSGWWKMFQRSDLDSLIAQALASNYDLRKTLSRLDQAYASFRKAGNALIPTVQAAGKISESHAESKNASGMTASSNSDSYQLSLSSSYELDLWGRVRASASAAELTWRATAEDVQSSQLSISSAVAQAWLNILLVRSEQDLLERQIRLNETVLKIQQTRFANGQASALDVMQQKGQLLKVASERPLLTMQEKNYLDALAVLLGIIPGSEDLSDRVEGRLLPAESRLPDAGIPAQLLQARPDIRAAALRLMSADATLRSAKSNLFPSLTLNPQMVFSSGQASLLWTNWVASLAASLTGPIFDAGSRRLEVQRTRAATQESVYAYAQTVATAVREVESALAGVQARRDYRQALAERLTLARVTEQEAQQSYFNGTTTYLVYLTQIQNTQTLERSLLTEDAQNRQQWISLAVALGGAKI